MSLTRLAYSGARWTAISSGMVTAIQFLQTLVLAKILSPEDFGLMAIVLLTLTFVQIYADMGISSALVHRQDATREQLSSLFWLNFLTGFLVFLVAVALSPVVAWVFGDPRLGSLTLCAALILLIWPIGGQFGLLLQKELAFRTLALCEIASMSLAAIVTIATAIDGYGPYSLVLGKLTGAGLTAAVYSVIGWRRWRPALYFSLRDIRGYLSFGFYQLGQATLVFAANQIDQLYVGAVLGTQALGYYTFAWNLVLQPMMKLNFVLTRVAFPMFARIQLDNKRLQRGYLMLLWLLASINAPILIGCAATASLLVPTIFGSQWMPAVGIVQTLALVSLLISMTQPADAVMLATGRTDLAFKWRLSLFFPELAGICIGGFVAGVQGVALAKLFLNLVYWIAQYFFVLRTLIGSCLKEYVNTVGWPVAMAGVMGLVVLWRWPAAMMTDVSALVLAGEIAFGAVVYCALWLLLQRSRIYQLREQLLVR